MRLNKRIHKTNMSPLLSFRKEFLIYGFTHFLKKWFLCCLWCQVNPETKNRAYIFLDIEKLCTIHFTSGFDTKQNPKLHTTFQYLQTVSKILCFIIFLIPQTLNFCVFFLEYVENHIQNFFLRKPKRGDVESTLSILYMET